MVLSESLHVDFADEDSTLDADDIDGIYYTDNEETFKDKLIESLKDLGGDILEDIIEAIIDSIF